jgi:tetratricopeptide (TPR) repeat protein
MFAQKGKVTSALSFKEAGKLDEALAVIEEAIDDNNSKAKSSIEWPRTWEVRGEIFQAIFQSKDENYRKLHVDPLAEAFKSYRKAIELDHKNRFSNSIKIKLTLLIGDFINQAETSFNSQDYEKALVSFEQILAIENTPIYVAESPATIDTVIIYNAALSAYNAKRYAKAIDLFKKVAAYKYNGAATYERLSESYLGIKDTAGAIEIMQEGLKEYPENSLILTQLINIYEKVNKVEEAIKYMDLAISNEPDNESFYLYQGFLFERMNDIEGAIKSYQKAIELKFDNFDALLNLGIIYYNRGVKQVDVANAVPGNQTDKYEFERSKADLAFKEALPYFEKAYEINARNNSLLEALKNVYYRLQMLDKYEALIEKINLTNQ